jgi:hypothetical protein
VTASTPFPIDPVQTAITVAYHNTMYIADRVLPRVPVGREEFKYLVYPVEETFRLPATHVSRRGQVNEVLLTATETIAQTQDYGLEDPIPFPDIDQAASAGIRSPVENATMTLTDYSCWITRSEPRRWCSTRRSIRPPTRSSSPATTSGVPSPRRRATRSPTSWPLPTPCC